MLYKNVARAQGVYIPMGLKAGMLFFSFRAK